MSYWEDKYIDYLAEQDGQFGGDGWRDDFNPRASLEKHMSFRYDGVPCPDCGGEMVSRKGQFGIFWGCLKYPNCRGTRDSQGRSKADRQKWKDEQKKDKDIMDDLDREVDAHDLKEGQKTSFNRNVK